MDLLHHDQISEQALGAKTDILRGRGNGYKPMKHYCTPTFNVRQNEEMDQLHGNVASQQGKIDFQTLELIETKKDLTVTRKELIETKKELLESKKELFETKVQLIKTRKEQADTKVVLSNQV